MSCLCLSVCLSVTLVYCGQTVRWMKMPLGTKIGIGPGHIVLHGDPAPRAQNRGTAPNFWPMSWQNGWIDQDATWYRGKPWPRPLVLDGDPASPLRKRYSSPHFSALVYCGQTAGWIKMPLGTKLVIGPVHTVLDGDPAYPRRGAQQRTHFSIHVYCGQTVAHLSNC